MASFQKITLHRMRSIQWDASNKWEFELDGLENLFGGFTSATTLELGFFGVTNESLGSSNIEYISGRTLPTLTISYVDSEDLKVTRFITEWMASCVSQDGYEVALVEDASKKFTVHKLKSTGKSVYKWIGKVIPSGNIIYNGDTDGSVPNYQVTFSVVAGSLQWVNLDTNEKDNRFSADTTNLNYLNPVKVPSFF